MFEWIFIQDDLLARARYSIIETYLVFVVVFMGLWWILLTLFYQKRREQAERIAKSMGFDSWPKFRKQFTDDAIQWSAVFLLSVIFIYTVTNLMEIKTAYYHAPLAKFADECREIGGMINCEKGRLNLDNSSIFSSGFSFHNYSVISTPEPE